MTRRLIAALTAATLTLALSPAAAAQEDFTHSLELRNGQVELIVTYHDDRETMVTCTPDQHAAIGARSIERVTALLPALNARLISRKDPDGTTIEVLLDAACYEGGIMGLGGYGRGDERIAMVYEETTDPEAGWGPPEE